MVRTGFMLVPTVKILAVKFWQKNGFEAVADVIELPQSRMVWLGRDI